MKIFKIFLKRYKINKFFLSILNMLVIIYKLFHINFLPFSKFIKLLNRQFLKLIFFVIFKKFRNSQKWSKIYLCILNKLVIIYKLFHTNFFLFSKLKKLLNRQMLKLKFFCNFQNISKITRNIQNFCLNF